MKKHNIGCYAMLSIGLVSVMESVIFSVTHDASQNDRPLWIALCGVILVLAALFWLAFRKPPTPSKPTPWYDPNKHDDDPKTTDWSYDFPSLPQWEYHDWPYTFDYFIEIPEKDMLFCIYSVVEVSMLDYLGYLAILKNKQCPELFFLSDSQSGLSFLPYFWVNKTGDLLFLKASIYKKDTKQRIRPIMIIDTSKWQFSYVETNTCNPCYEVMEVENGVFEIQVNKSQNDKTLNALDGKQINTRNLTWHDLEKLNDLPQMVF